MKETIECTPFMDCPRNQDLELGKCGLQTLASHAIAVDGHNECEKTLNASV